MKPSGFFRSALALYTAAAMLAACAGSATSIEPRGALPQRTSATVRSAVTGSYVYAADCCGVLNNGGISVYDPGLMRVVRTVVKGAFNPSAIALDRTGALYVVNLFYGVTEYDRGSVRPSRSIKGLYGALTLALDESNDLYVANCISCIPYQRRAQTTMRDSIVVYGPKQTKPLRTITQGIHTPQALAVDAAGNLYVANVSSSQYHPAVTVYGPGSTKPLRRIARGIVRPESLALDGSGDLFVANGSSEVIEYAAGSSRVLRKITDQIASPQALAVDVSGTLYIANPDQFPARGWVSLYAPGSSTAEYVIVAGINDPVALAVGGDGDLYVASDAWGKPDSRGWIGLYPPNARRPTRVIKGDRYGEPTALALGPP